MPPVSGSRVCRPFQSATVIVVPVPAMVFAAGIALPSVPAVEAVAASCFAASRNRPCTVPVGSPSLPRWARSPTASKPYRSVMPAFVFAA